MIESYFKSEDKNFTLIESDLLDVLPTFEFKFDMIFADPPYFLSNDGLTIESGKIVSVNKGKWDSADSYDFVNEFNRKWISAIRDKLKENGTIWICGTKHNIFSIGQILQELNFKILNIVVWEKTNPPPNFSCRYFTYSTEFIIWARKSEKVPHYFNYELMKKINGDKQMKDVWKLPAIAKWEKEFGKHPTQKPLPLLTRIVLASSKENDWILDPFCGSSTTGIAANIFNRRYLGIDLDKQFLDLGVQRKKDIENISKFNKIKNKLLDNKDMQLNIFELDEDQKEVVRELDFIK